MNNDFPADGEIENLEIPILIIHSKEDKQVPIELGKNLYNASDKNHTHFWEIEGKYIKAMYDYEKEYVEVFMNMAK